MANNAQIVGADGIVTGVYLIQFNVKNKLNEHVNSNIILFA